MSFSLFPQNPVSIPTFSLVYLFLSLTVSLFPSLYLSVSVYIVFRSFFFLWFPRFRLFCFFCLSVLLFFVSLSVYIWNFLSICLSVFLFCSLLQYKKNSYCSRHSPAETLRGSIWRGRDCSDINSEIYPGRRSLEDDKNRDSNCNGIFGVSPDTG